MRRSRQHARDKPSGGAGREKGPHRQQRPEAEGRRLERLSVGKCGLSNFVFTAALLLLSLQSKRETEAQIRKIT